MQLTRLFYEGDAPENPFRFDLLLTLVRFFQGDAGIWYSVPGKWLPQSAASITMKRGGEPVIQPQVEFQHH